MITIDGGSGTILHNGIEVASQKMVDQWRITSAKSNSGQSVFDANWERNDTSSSLYGSNGMSESSGIFTFPSTGIYLITFSGYATGNGDRYIGVWIERTINNSDYTRASEGYSSAYNSGASTYVQVSHECTFDVTDTSTHKIRFKTDNIGTCNWDGSSTIQRSGALFTRLGDT